MACPGDLGRVRQSWDHCATSPRRQRPTRDATSSGCRTCSGSCRAHPSRSEWSKRCLPVVGTPRQTLLHDLTARMGSSHNPLGGMVFAASVVPRPTWPLACPRCAKKFAPRPGMETSPLPRGRAPQTHSAMPRAVHSALRDSEPFGPGVQLHRPEVLQMRSTLRELLAQRSGERVDVWRRSVLRSLRVLTGSDKAILLGRNRSPAERTCARV